MNTATTNQFPTTTSSLETYQQAQKEDQACLQLVAFKMAKQKIAITAIEQILDSFTVCDQLLLYETQIVVPKLL